MRRSSALLLCALALGACTLRGPGPALSAVEPASAVRDLPVDVVLQGQRFHPRTRLDFDRPSQSLVDETFAVTVGDTAADEVHWVDETTLTAHFNGLPTAGTFDVGVTDPLGATASLPGAFMVVDPVNRLSLETRPDGTGTPLGPLTLHPGAKVSLYAVGRDPAGQSLGAVVADWAVSAPLATLTPDAGSGTVLEALALGEAQVTASALHFTSAQLAVTVVPCTADADCLDACHANGTCALATGLCTLGASTRDADGDGFVDATCPGGDDCDDSNAAIHPGALEEPPGSAACTDGKDNDCNGLIDWEQASCRPDSAPLPAFTVTPGAVVTGQAVAADASATVDREEPTAGLTFEWDWDGDGVFEAQGITSTHTFAAVGRAVVTLKVTDAKGLWALATRPVFVTAASNLAVVTTDLDESDPGATPATPGGSGLSLREALAWAQATAGAQVVLVPPGRVVKLSSGVSSGSGTVTVTGFGAIIDGANTPGNASCLTLAGPAEVLGLEVRGCRGAGLTITGTPVTVSWCRLHDDGDGAQLRGANVVFGPGNDVTANSGSGVVVDAAATVVDDDVHGHGGAGIQVRNGGATSHLVGNRVFDNSVGVDLLAQANGVFVWHGTFVANMVGVRAATATAALEVRNNIFAAQTGWAIDGPQGAVATIDANDFFGNASGACRRCTTLGPRSLGALPQFVDEASADYRPSILSPVVDRGVDLGVDRNGPLPGLFLGAAPDLGAFEVR